MIRSRPGRAFVADDRDVSSSYLWANGMVMTFDLDGEQIPELQGRRTPELAEAIRARSTAETEWIGWGEDGPAVWPRNG